MIHCINFGSLYKGGKKRHSLFKNNAYISIAGNKADSPEIVRDVYNYFRKEVFHLSSDQHVRYSDLEKEDGSFHSDNTGVFHFGFDKNELVNIVKDSGFKNVVFENINTIKKPQRDFGVFLLSAKK